MRHGFRGGHGGFGHRHYGRMWRGYGYPFFRWRGCGCCGPLFFLMLLAVLVPIAVAVVRL